MDFRLRRVFGLWSLLRLLGFWRFLGFRGLAFRFAVSSGLGVWEVSWDFGIVRLGA